MTIISYGAMMRPTLEAAVLLAEEGIEAEVVDLLTISPLDDELFVKSAKKTGRVVIVHEAPRSFGPGAETIWRSPSRGSPVMISTRRCSLAKKLLYPMHSGSSDPREN